MKTTALKTWQIANADKFAFDIATKNGMVLGGIQASGHELDQPGRQASATLADMLDAAAKTFFGIDARIQGQASGAPAGHSWFLVTRAFTQAERAATWSDYIKNGDRK